LKNDYPSFIKKYSRADNSELYLSEHEKKSLLQL